MSAHGVRSYSHTLVHAMYKRSRKCIHNFVVRYRTLGCCFIDKRYIYIYAIRAKERVKKYVNLGIYIPEGNGMHIVLLRFLCPKYCYYAK